ncbi:hypothetical protein FNV43_RR14591 [Rhamnella rubrinervis]|uniref:Peptidase metallopeptidase domain-containing protein n=1 Tax=Rhamnella rubrinervis TaxID=2594499 RepID=A0A8K0H3L5_9ROSA|nr:hypothetical protein FNV43_RR14591 [Rhamnella rubrinervis]
MEDRSKPLVADCRSALIMSEPIQLQALQLEDILIDRADQSFRPHYGGKFVHTAANAMTSHCLKAFSVIILVIQLLHLIVVQSSMIDSSNSFRNLEGLSKGKAHPAIPKLKRYLNKFGYLNYVNESSLNGDHFDGDLEWAVKRFQRFFHLEVTGIVDSHTMQLLNTPRCGVPDTVSSQYSPQYAFIPGNPRWPMERDELVYSVVNNGKHHALNFEDVRTAVKFAFYEWSDNSKFTFNERSSPEWTTTDIYVSFQSGDHGDGFPFDGPGNVLAHAFPPEVGALHFDADEVWSTNDTILPTQVDLMSVTLHEIGHILGLAHSEDGSAVMYPYFPYGAIHRHLEDDDKKGIEALYNF